MWIFVVIKKVHNKGFELAEEIGWYWDGHKSVYRGPWIYADRENYLIIFDLVSNLE